MLFDATPFRQRVLLSTGADVLQLELEGYFLDFGRGDPKTLVISFEGAGGAVERPDRFRRNWSEGFLRKRGLSFLGIKPKRIDWYRGKDLHRFFRSNAFQDFAGQYERVIFTGSSMGGFGALAFSSAVPGSIVIAHCPQSTLSPTLVPWEIRFPDGRAQDWEGDFADGRDVARYAARSYVIFDPFHEPDRRHVARLTGAPTYLKIPFVGHNTADPLLRMGVIQQMMDRAMTGALTVAEFASMARKRRDLPIYYLNLRKRVQDPALRTLCLERAAALDPADGELNATLIAAAIAIGDCARAISLYETYRELRNATRSQLPSLFLSVAQSYFETGRSQDAAATLERIVLSAEHSYLRPEITAFRQRLGLDERIVENEATDE